MKSDKLSGEFPLVGVGASAGGIDAFKRFLGAIPNDSGMAYILVQHLSPSHDSILPEILARFTDIPVHEITDDCHIEPDNIYVIPENSMLEVTDHSLRLTPRKKEGLPMPIDVFFSSLGKIHKSMAAGIVLSGTARDGTVGLGNIKEHGGITLAENPKSATWGGMPQSAIDAGVVDFVLWPEEMPQKLIQVYKEYETDGTKKKKHDKIDGDGLKSILSIVRKKSGVDFSYYKKPTVHRRIERRMAINQKARADDYYEFLKENGSEQEALFGDLLIKVTSFFRDPEIFEELKHKIFPKLLEKKSDDGPLRIWVAGCATGEEAYSLAICLFEVLNDDGPSRPPNRKIQIFASDISEPSINKARAGVYSSTELEPLSETQLENYFTRTDGSYKVIKSIRDTIVFTVHNFLMAPPFGKVDLISCRNVFIYLDPFLQKKALSTFHYALRDNGLLLMGKSETTGKHLNLFTPFSKNAKIYARKAGEGRYDQAITARKPAKAPFIDKKGPATPALKTDFRRSAEKVLASDYAPASIIVDEHYEIVHINGDIEPFVVPPQGKPTHELLKVVRKELAFELRNALYKTKSLQKKVGKTGIGTSNGRERFFTDLEIVPLTDTLDLHYLILFRKRTKGMSFLEEIWRKLGATIASSAQGELRQRNTAMEKELEQLREDMRGISEEQDAYNEELQSANEELLSSNEEMQSLNEELETSKEELQSTNEELIVVNRELLEKQEDLSDSLIYLDAVIATMREPFLVLDRDFRIQKASTSYCKKFDIDETDLSGKYFFEVQMGLWDHDMLRSMLEKVLPGNEKIVDKEMVISTKHGEANTFLFNAREIVRQKGAIKLILLSISDITGRKRIEQNYIDTIDQLNRTNEQLDQFVHVASHDLQEPLRKITIFATRITEKRDGISEKQMETYLDKIKFSSVRMSALLRDMLSYSRLTHPKELFEQTDLNAVVSDILIDFEQLIEQKEAELNIGNLPTLEAIPLQINQLLHNLIGNALKFSVEGVPPLISISSGKMSAGEVGDRPSLDPNLSYCELVVRDNGIGFGAKYHQQIFTIFQRLNPTSHYQGTGIGLALCKKITENHHGEIFARSREGKGAAFHVLLPLKQTD